MRKSLHFLAALALLACLFSPWQPASGTPADPAAKQERLVVEDFPLNDDLMVLISTGQLLIYNLDQGLSHPLVDGPVVSFNLSPTGRQFYYTTPNGQVGLGTLDFTGQHQSPAPGSERAPSRGLMITAQLLPDSTGAPIAAAPDGPVPRVFWAQDGSQFAYRAGDGSYHAYTLQGDPLALPNGVAYFFGWSHDNRWFAYCTADQSLWVTRQDGTPVQVDTNVDCEDPRFTEGNLVQWSPTQPVLAYSRGFDFTALASGADADIGQTRIYDPQTGLTLAQADGITGMWSPDGQLLSLVQIVAAGATGYVLANLPVIDRSGRQLLVIEDAEITR